MWVITMLSSYVARERERELQLPQVFNSEDYVLHVQRFCATVAKFCGLCVVQMGYTRHFATPFPPFPRGTLQRLICLPLDGKS